MQDINKKKKSKFKIILKKFGTHKKPFFKIIVLNKLHRYRYYIGKIELFSKTNLNLIYLNKMALCFWLSKGAVCSFKVYFLITLLLLKK